MKTHLPLIISWPKKIIKRDREKKRERQKKGLREKDTILDGVWQRGYESSIFEIKDFTTYCQVIY